MLKCEEKERASSCWNKAREDELVFILLERDKAAAATVRFWTQERIRLGLNAESDDQIAHALLWANSVGREVY